MSKRDNDAARPPRYLVAGSRPWNRTVFDEALSPLPGAWHFAASPEALSLERVRALDPRYIFFLHWSWKVPQALVEAYECVCFHMTDVPYGRGGSPLQNLIARGHRQTKLSALRMSEAFDAGPVYLKADLCLEGGAEEVYLRSSRLSAELIARIVAERPEPVPQRGEPVVFKRRTPDQSRIGAAPTLRALHDFLRMLDAEGYPRAYLDHGGFRYTFSRAALYDGRVQADVTITPLKEDEA